MKKESMNLEKPCFGMKASAECISFLKKLEGFHDGNSSVAVIEPTPDCAGYWTIGYGHAILVDGEPCFSSDWSLESIKPFCPVLMSESDAVALLKKDLEMYEEYLISKLNIEVCQFKFDALLLFVYNCWYSKTLFKMVNARENSEEIEYWWSSHYIRSNGVILKGLIKRRAFEASLFRFGWGVLNEKGGCFF